LADSAAYAKATACQGILVPGYDSTELAEVWMFSGITIRAFIEYLASSTRLKKEIPIHQSNRTQMIRILYYFICICADPF